MVEFMILWTGLHKLADVILEITQKPFYIGSSNCISSHKFWDQSPSPIINVVWKYLRQFLGTGFGVATLPICCNIEYGGGAWFISAKWTIPEFPETFPGIDLVSLIYVRYCRSGNTSLINEFSWTFFVTWWLIGH